VSSKQPVPTDFTSWPEYWTAQGTPWRTEPEIDEERQRFLATRRAVPPIIKQGIYPFRDENGPINLTRADVEWLLATHDEGQGPVDWDDPAQRKRMGLDLRGAVLTGQDLQSLPLARLVGGLTRDDRNYASEYEHMLAAPHMEGTILSYAHLEDAVLTFSHLQGCSLHHAHLEGAILYGAHLEADAPANLSSAIFDANSNLARVTLGNKHGVGPRFLSVRWNDIILTAVDWSSVRRTEDESVARTRWAATGEAKAREARLRDYDRAVQTYRQLAVTLSSQGLNEHAERFAYRAQLMQRVVLRRQRHYLRWLGSLFLWLIAGYGYRPLRSVLTYLVVVGGFAALYFALGSAHSQALTWNEALVVSLTSFHGRGFFATAFQPGDPQAAVAAIEAVFGLLIEITFIATFTNRFFAR
jgi:uncharacterized protein YjbI with pentapeptide repeats